MAKRQRKKAAADDADGDGATVTNLHQPGSTPNLRRHHIDGKDNNRVRRGADGWDTDDRGYSEHNIYTTSINEHGQTARINGAVSPGLHAELKAFIESAVVPEYRTVGDFMRDAIHHRLHYWADRIDDGKVVRQLTSTLRTAEVVRAGNETRNEQQYISTLSATMQDMRGARDWALLRSLIDDGRHHASETREPFRSEILGLCDVYEEFADRSDAVTPPP